MTEQQDADDFFDDDVPSTDPNIRRDYEAALGRCLLAFNQLDNLLGKVLGTVLARLGRTDLQRERSFSQRVDFLDILKRSAEGDGLAGVPISDLRSVAGDRNLLAHAHFDQNPIDGSYEVVNRKGETAQHYAPQRIDGVANRIQKVWMELRYAEAFYEFAGDPSSVEASQSNGLA